MSLHSLAKYEKDRNVLGFLLLEFYSVTDTLGCSRHEMRFRYMKNLQPECQNPAIILNPHLKELILKYRCYHTPSGDIHLTGAQVNQYFLHFPYGTFRMIKNSLTTDELAQYFVVDSYGDEQPLFLQVPCGHCILCREKKANEWEKIFANGISDKGLISKIYK